MLEPTVTPRPSVVALAASIALSGLLLAGCERDAKTPAVAVAPETSPPPVVTLAPAAPLNRAGLLAAMDAAASSYASGEGGGDASLVGRRFLVRQAFGCAPSPTDDPQATGQEGIARVTRTADGRSLKLSLTPGDWAGSSLISDSQAAGWEVVEGIWLTRPWMRTEGCSAVPVSGATGDLAPLLQPQTMGLASVFEADGSRVGRRNGRAFEYTLRGEEDEPVIAPPQGFRLVLEGRLEAFPDGRAIRCHGLARDARPLCIAAIQVDRVSFEDAAGTTLSDWSRG